VAVLDSINQPVERRDRTVRSENLGLIKIVLPADLRNQDHIEPGQEFAIERVESGEYLIKRLPSGETSGLVDWLLSCPEKGWFEPLSSESTDTL